MAWVKWDGPIYIWFNKYNLNTHCGDDTSQRLLLSDVTINLTVETPNFPCLLNLPEGGPASNPWRAGLTMLFLKGHLPERISPQEQA